MTKNNSMNYDKIIEKIMENESAAKHLKDDEYIKVIEFIKSHLLNFLQIFYKYKSFKSICKRSKLIVANNSKNYHYQSIEENIICLCTEFIKNIKSGNLDLQLEFIKSFIDSLYKNILK